MNSYEDKVIFEDMVDMQKHFDDYKASLPSFRENLSDDEKYAHSIIRDSLWAIYPKECTLNITSEQDEESDHCALLVLNQLKRAGVSISRCRVADDVLRPE